ncbi:MAG: AAA family ATPase [Alphaproteobacteria bacterium]|nr:AAA family ATPase [Alphaproteobacteria bacterium]
MNAWRDFNDAPPLPDDGEGAAPAGPVALDRLPSAGQSMPPAGVQVTLDTGQIATFLDVVFGYCEGLIPVRGFVDVGQGHTTRPHNIWIPADASAADLLATYAAWAAKEGSAVYIIPGTVAEHGHARAEHVQQMQTALVDLDSGNIESKLAHLACHLGEPTLVVESGGRTAEGQTKLHAWWRLSEPATGADLALLCHLRGDIAAKVGGDPHFRSAHQPIRVPGTIYRKGGVERVVTIRTHNPRREVDLSTLAETVGVMPAMAGQEATASPRQAKAASLDSMLTTPVRAGGQDGWTRFEGASTAIGYYVRQVHEGRMTANEGWEAIRGYNQACLQPPWPEDRLKTEADAIWTLHVERNGPALERVAAAPVMTSMPAFTLGALLDDTSPMPDDIIAPRLLTPGGMLVLGGAPKVGKSDFLINLLVHAAAGVPFLRFTPPRPLRVFYLQAEIQYHYLRERLQTLRLDPATLHLARDNLVATPKLRMLLDEHGVALTISAIQAHFPTDPPDIICLDPIRNLFDGGPDGDGENDNTAMLFFLQSRVEGVREAVAPDAGLILCHHTKKVAKKALGEDPFMALSGASALRSFYTSGMIMFRPEEDQPERRLEIELRNGPALDPMVIDKRNGRWIELDARGERLVRQQIGSKLDAERNRRHDLILQIIAEEAEAGRLCTINAFASKFENSRGLGGKDTIRDRIGVLSIKGYIKFRRDVRDLGRTNTTSKHGFMVVRDMVLATGDEAVDLETGEITAGTVPVLPSHFVCPQSEALLPVENPEVWVLHDPEEGTQ